MLNAAAPSDHDAVSDTAANISLTIVVPQAAASDATARRKPAFISSLTKSAQITLAPSAGNAQTQTISCTTTCTATFSAVIGAATLSAALYDQINATGTMLASGSLTTTIVQSVANQVTITFNPVVSAIGLTSASFFTAGVPQSVAVQAIAYDPDGAIIIAPGSFITASGMPAPVTFSSSDNTGHVAVQGAPLIPTTAAINNVSVTYDGTPPRGNYQTTISALISGAISPSLNQTKPTVAVPIDIDVQAFVPTTQFYNNGAGVTTPVIGSDGNIWFAGLLPSGSPAVENVCRLNASSLALTCYPLPQYCRADQSANPMTLGSDGNLWVTEIGCVSNTSSSASIARITTGGVITQFAYTASFVTMFGAAPVLGSDGNIWINGSIPAPGGQYEGAFQRIASDGSQTTFPVPNSVAVRGSALAPNGSLVYISYAGSISQAYRFGMISMGGVISGDVPLTAGISSGSTFAPFTIYSSGDGNFYLGNSKISPTGTVIGNFDSAIGGVRPLTNGRFLAIASGPQGSTIYYVLPPGVTSLAGLLSTQLINSTPAQYPLLSGTMGGSVIGPDGNLWEVYVGPYDQGIIKVVW